MSLQRASHPPFVIASGEATKQSHRYPATKIAMSEPVLNEILRSRSLSWAVWDSSLRSEWHTAKELATTKKEMVSLIIWTSTLVAI